MLKRIMGISEIEEDYLKLKRNRKVSFWVSVGVSLMMIFLGIIGSHVPWINSLGAIEYHKVAMILGGSLLGAAIGASFRNGESALLEIAIEEGKALNK